MTYVCACLGASERQRRPRLATASCGLQEQGEKRKHNADSEHTFQSNISPIYRHSLRKTEDRSATDQHGPPLSGLPHSSAPVLPSPVPTVRVSSADHSTPWGWVPANVKVCQSCPVGAAELSAPLPRHSGVGWGAGEVQGAGREGLLMTESKSGQASSSPFRNTLILTGGILIKS